MSDILKGPLHSFASFCAGKIQVVKRFPKILALAIFGNGMNKKQREKLYSSLCGESTNLLFERINECKLETSIKWILPTKDRALNPKQQRVYWMGEFQMPSNALTEICCVGKRFIP